jgi:hypothetical protein
MSTSSGSTKFALRSFPKTAATRRVRRTVSKAAEPWGGGTIADEEELDDDEDDEAFAPPSS